MRTTLRLLCLLLAWAALLRPGSAQAQVQTQFNCDGVFYQIRQVGTTSHLYLVDRSSSTYTTTEVGTVGFGVLLNALAYNSQDGYMYAVTYPSSNTVDTTPINLYRLSINTIAGTPTPTATSLGTTNLPAGVQFASGTFDKSGNYYLSTQNTQTGSTTANQNTLFRLQPGSATPLTAVSIPLRNTAGANAGATFFDTAFNPVDNKIYGVLFPGSVYKIDVQGTTQAVVTTYSSGQAVLNNEYLGSAIFDISGVLYAYSNGTTGNTGKFYKINAGTDKTDATALGYYTQLSTIAAAAISDGASCINPGNAIDVVMSAPTQGTPISPTTFDVTYTIQVKNSGTSNDPNVQITDFLTGAGANSAFPGASSVTKQSLTIVNNAPTNGGAASTLAVNTAFTGTGNNANLLTTDQTLALGQSATITLTVRVVYPNAASVPLTAQNNTVFATSTFNTNPGYLYVNGTVVPPDNLLAYDFSTNSGTLPGLVDANTGAHGDDASPTPVLFPPSISGTVFEDVNYGGGAGRPFDNTAGTSARQGARVELYNSNGTFNQFTTTDATGNYAFTNLAASTYTVRVVNSTVTSSRNTGNVAGVLGVQTFVNGDVNRVGGEVPAKVDAAANSGTQTLAALTPNGGTTTPQSITSVTLGAAKSDVDFGFNFDLVVNTTDVTATANNAGQGSLRQFITNSNALTGEAALAQVYTPTTGATTALAAGKETSIFMIPNGTAVAGLRAGLTNQLTAGVAVITPAAALPAITGANTYLDGTTQTRDLNNPNNTTLGQGGPVGTGPTTLSQLNGPEVQLTGSAAIGIGLDITATATNTNVLGLAIYGFGNARDTDTDTNIRTAADNVTIAQNVLGSAATAFAAPATLTNADNLRITKGTTVTVTNNLIGFSNGKGIAINPLIGGVRVTNNELRSNGQGSSIYDGLDIQGNTATVSGNLFVNNGGQGIDSYNSGGSNSITNNTIVGNGRGTAANGPSETPGVRVYGSGNTLSQNAIYDNYGAGILLVNNASTTTISQNAIYGNGSVAALNNTAATGEVGIDLQSAGQNANTGATPFVTLNNSVTTGTNANGLVNYPILRTASVVGSNLVLTGYAKAGATIELFLAQANGTALNATGANFGQGKTYLTTLTEGATTGLADTDGSTGQSYGQSGATINGFAQGSDTNANGFTFTIPLSSLPAGALTGGTLAAGTLLTSTATLSAATSEFSGNVASTVTPALTGYVYEDVNYGGGLGRSRATLGAAAVGRPGAKVELYNSTGALVATNVTDANGLYSFNVVAGTGYTVRVVNSSVLSGRAGASATSGDATTGYVSSQVGVQTYNGTTNRVGGESPNLTDAGANTGTQTLAALSSGAAVPESIAGSVSVTAGGTTNTGPDFGFNFDLVVNNNDAGQGSLRQFIQNSNALGGEAALAQVYTPTTGATTALATGLETSIFMIPNGTAVAGQRAGLTNKFATTTGTSTATTIALASALPAVTGPATAIDGGTQTRSTGDSNAAVATAGAESNGPEVLINLNQLSGITLSANNDQLVGVGVTNSPASGQGVLVNGNATGVVISNNTINNNGANIVFAASTAASAATISGNIIRNATQQNADGILLQGGNSNLTITNNQLLNNAGFGIDFVGANTSNTISGNTFAGNGNVSGSDQLSGIGLRGTGSNNNTISTNTFTNNNGAGIIAENGTTGNVFTRNSFSGNGVGSGTGLGLAIDLMSSNATNNGDGVTRNDSGDPDTGANGQINFPILSKVVLNADNTVTVTGFARPSTVVELYLAAADATNFGEGQTYLSSYSQGTTGTAATYGPGNVNGLNQGTDTTLPFTYTFTPTAAQLTALRASGAALTSTATLTAADASGNFGTSEFSGNARVLTPPVPNDVTNVAIASSSTQVALSPGLSATPSGQVNDVTVPTANSIASYTVRPASNGTLYYNNVAVTAATTVPVANLGQLTFTPTLGFKGTATFTYTATDANGTLSTTHNTNGTVTSGPATYIFQVQPADVTTTIAGPSTLNAGQPSGTYTVAYTNNGPGAAASVTQTVTLPTGATNISATGGGVISGTTITFPQTASLGVGASNVYQFSFTAPTGSTTTATITSNVGTASNQDGNLASDVATINPVTINEVADVATNITGASPVAAGGTGSFTATFTNNGYQTANNVVGKVQLPLGLSNVTTSGGTYDASTGVITYAINNLSSGASATPLTITYTQPATGSVTAASAISTTTNQAGQTSNDASQATISPATTINVATYLSGPATTTAGAQVTYNVTTSNPGTATAASVSQTVTLPSGATNIFVTGGGVISGSTVTFPSIAYLAPGQALNNTVSFTAPSATSFDVLASVTATGDAATTGDNAAKATTTTSAATAGSANLYTTISPSATNVTAGTAVTFTVAQGNNGPNAAASVVSRVALPVGLPITVGGATSLKLNGATPTSVSGTVATYPSGTYDSSTGQVTFSTITTQNSAATPASYTLTFNAPASGVVTATATVASTTPDVMMSNNVASTEVTVNPAATELATALTGPDAATPGQRVTYTVKTTNNGPSDAAGISQVVAIPAGLPLMGANAVTLGGAAPASVTGTVASYTGIGTYDSSTGLVTFTNTAGAQTTGGTVSNTLAYNVPANGDASLVNTARVASTTNDPNLTNNVAAVITTIQPSADVQVALTGPSSVALSSATVGTAVTYNVTTTSNGPSVASSVTTTVQLPTGLSGVAVIGYDGTTLANSATSGYNSADGKVRFPAVMNQASGSANASAGSISFVTPANVYIILPTAMATLTGTTDPNLANNVATVATVLTAPTAAMVDLQVTISRSSGTGNIAAGSPITFTVSTINASNSTADASAGVVTTVQLPAGLTSNGGTVTATNGAYDNVTGLVTFTTTAVLGKGNNITNTIAISQAPGAGPLVATASVLGRESDPPTGNNVASTTVGITSVVDVATTISGPATASLNGPVTYTITTTNNGPSAAGSVQQQVTLPAGITSYSVNGGAAVQLNGGSASTAPTTLTLPTPSTLAAGSNNTVANTVTFNAPGNFTTSYNVVANVTATGDAVATAGNNTATLTTARYNQPPVATYVTNTLQTPEGNTATVAMLISPLAAIDAENTLSTTAPFKILTVPTSAQGVLTYNNNGTYATVAANQTLNATQAGTLRFLPTTGYVGNATFTYSATDAAGNVSNAATYLIPVGQDISTVATATTQTKGGNNPYVKDDILAYIIDPNTAQYTANAGATPGQVYNSTTGALLAGAANGLATTGINAVLTSGALPAGVDLNPSTGQIYVRDASQMVNYTMAKSYSVTITTTDLYGGTNPVQVNFTIGAYPLPVTLVAFTAEAVRNRDAQLSWSTASEQHNDHFEVERSLDGTSFTKLGQVAGQGTTTTRSAYSFTDAGVAAQATGPVYYRLKQVDTDGTSTYSPVRPVTFTHEQVALSLTLFPNPASTSTALDLSQLPATAKVQVLVLDATGRTVLSTTLGGGLPQPLDVSNLAQGTYNVVVSGTQPDGSPLHQVLRFIKE